MSCRGKAIHLLGECDCYFKPRDYLKLVKCEQAWLELLLRLIHHRAYYPDAGENEIIGVMLRDRAHRLRN
jgi:hypothetical protein